MAGAAILPVPDALKPAPGGVVGHGGSSTAGVGASGSGLPSVVLSCCRAVVLSCAGWHESYRKPVNPCGQRTSHKAGASGGTRTPTWMELFQAIYLRVSPSATTVGPRWVRERSRMAAS